MVTTTLPHSWRKISRKIVDEKKLDSSNVFSTKTASVGKHKFVTMKSFRWTNCEVASTLTTPVSYFFFLLVFVYFLFFYWFCCLKPYFLERTSKADKIPSLFQKEKIRPDLNTLSLKMERDLQYVSLLK